MVGDDACGVQEIGKQGRDTDKRLGRTCEEREITPIFFPFFPSMGNYHVAPRNSTMMWWPCHAPKDDMCHACTKIKVLLPMVPVP
jgi:hypothetical protein